MPTPDPDANPPHNPFGLLRAILIGTALGFLAVLAVPYLLPSHQAPLTYATANLQPAPVKVSGAANRSTQKHSSSADVKTAEARTKPPIEPGAQIPGGSAPSPEAKQSEEAGQPSVSNPGEPSKESAPAEPVLIPAVNLKFPKTFSTEEMTAALQPLLSFRISDGDAAAIKDVISSVSRGDDAGARAAIRKISDPAAKSFAEWKRLRASSVDFNEVMAFRRGHPLFPEPAQEFGTEKALFLSDATAADVLKFYTNRNPMTGAGKASLGAALMETGERERGLSLIKFAWRRYNLDPLVQERFASRFGSLLDAEDQRHRKLMIEARARQLDDPGKKLASASEGKGLKGAARLRAKRAGAHIAHNGRHGRKTKVVARRSRGRRHGEIPSGIEEKQAAIAGKAHAFGITSLSEQVRLKKRHGNASPDENTAPGAESQSGKVTTSTGRAADPVDKEDKSGKKTLQSKAAENALKL